MLATYVAITAVAAAGAVRMYVFVVVWSLCLLAAPFLPSELLSACAYKLGMGAVTV